jgi:hypothetical protein
MRQFLEVFLKPKGKTPSWPYFENKSLEITHYNFLFILKISPTILFSERIPKVELRLI